MEKQTKSRGTKASCLQCIIVGILIFMMIAPAQGAQLKNTKEYARSSENKAWTALYYIDCDYDSNNYDPLQQIFIDEIASTDTINSVVIQDKEEEPAFLYYIDELGDAIVLEELGEVNMGDPATLSSFVEYGKQYYPADRYILWMYDHGGGWKGACMDTTNNDPGLTMDEMHQGLSDAGGVDVICFFACLMSSLEAVYELRDCVDVYVGSEDLAWGSWFDGVCGETNSLLDAEPIISNNDLGTEIVTIFDELNNPPTDVLTASAIQASNVDALVESLDDLAKYFITHWFRSYGKVRDAHDTTFLLAEYGEWAEVFEVYDLKGFLLNLPDSDEKTAALAAFDEAVIAEVHGYNREDTYGLSIFFPSHISPYELVQEYKEAGLGLDLPNDTLWNELLFFLIVTNTILKK